MPFENGKKYSPPYISPRSFYNLLEKLKENIPGRVDRSYLDTKFSGAASTQLMAALRFMNLIDSKNVPTHHLRLLVASQDEERKKRYKDLCNNCYEGLFANGSFDLQTATYAQLEEFFQAQYGVDGDVRRKCIKFFTAIAAEGGIPLSDYITSKVRTTPTTSAPRVIAKKALPKTPDVGEVLLKDKNPSSDPLLEKLLDKFPGWDAAWTDEQKVKWLDGFNLFMQKIYPDMKK